MAQQRRVQVDPGSPNPAQSPFQVTVSPSSSYVVPGVDTPSSNTALAQLAKAFGGAAKVGGEILQRETERRIGEEAITNVEQLEREAIDNAEEFRRRSEAGEINVGDNPWTAKATRRLLYSRMAARFDGEFDALRASGDISAVSPEELQGAYRDFMSRKFTDTLGIPYDPSDPDIAVGYVQPVLQGSLKQTQRFQAELTQRNERQFRETYNQSFDDLAMSLDPSVGITEDNIGRVQVLAALPEHLGYGRIDGNQMALGAIIGASRSVVLNIDTAGNPADVLSQFDKASEALQLANHVEAGDRMLADRPWAREKLEQARAFVESRRQAYLEGARKAEGEARKRLASDIEGRYTVAVATRDTQAMQSILQEGLQSVSNGDLEPDALQGMFKLASVITEDISDTQNTMISMNRDVSPEFIEQEMVRAATHADTLEDYMGAIESLGPLTSTERDAVGELWEQTRDERYTETFKDGERLLKDKYLRTNTDFMALALSGDMSALMGKARQIKTYNRAKARLENELLHLRRTKGDQIDWDDFRQAGTTLAEKIIGEEQTFSETTGQEDPTGTVRDVLKATEDRIKANLETKEAEERRQAELEAQTVAEWKNTFQRDVVGKWASANFRDMKVDDFHNQYVVPTGNAVIQAANGVLNDPKATPEARRRAEDYRKTAINMVKLGDIWRRAKGRSRFLLLHNSSTTLSDDTLALPYERVDDLLTGPIEAVAADFGIPMDGIENSGRTGIAHLRPNQFRPDVYYFALYSRMYQDMMTSTLESLGQPTGTEADE